MKITVPSKEKEHSVELGDILIGGSGTSYIVSKRADGEFTLFDMTQYKVITHSYKTIAEMIQNYFGEYTHYSSDIFELNLVKK